MKNFFNETEIRNIEEALKKAEHGSDGEIVPIFAKASGTYQSSKYIFAILICLFCTALAIDLFDSKLPIILSMILSLIVSLNIAYFFPWTCLPLIAKSEMAEEVNRRAAECFYNYNLGNTKKGSALLIYVSNYEHIAVVKTDLRSSKKLSTENLQEICNLVVNGLKTKKAAHGLILAIEKSGALLKQNFPNNSNNPNELENKIYFL